MKSRKSTTIVTKASNTQNLINVVEERIARSDGGREHGTPFRADREGQSDRLSCREELADGLPGMRHAGGCMNTRLFFSSIDPASDREAPFSRREMSTKAVNIHPA